MTIKHCPKYNDLTHCKSLCKKCCKKVGRYGVGKAIAGINRYKNDLKHKEKRKNRGKKYSKLNRHALNNKSKKYIKSLNEFFNLHCKECDNLIYYKNISGYCRIHYQKHIIRKK